jgi:hypothetical protein
LRCASFAAVAFLLVACGSGGSRVKADVLAGLREVGVATPDDAALKTQLERLRHDPPKSSADRHARRLALAGLVALRRGVRANRELMRNDSGNLGAAQRDGARAYRAFARGNALLAAAAAVYGPSSR